MLEKCASVCGLTGRANYDGTFVLPDVAAGTLFAAGSVAIKPNVRLRHASKSIGGYLETGADPRGGPSATTVLPLLKLAAA